VSFGSGILDDISRHVRDCKTCQPLQPGGGTDDPNTQQALKQCFTYAALHRDWKRWMASPDY
jgi:hypothetical protein